MDVSLHMVSGKYGANMQNTTKGFLYMNVCHALGLNLMRRKLFKECVLEYKFKVNEQAF